MKRFFLLPWLILSLGAASLARSADAPPEHGTLPEPSSVGHFLALDAIDWKSVLPAPPAPGSVAALADIETVVQVQMARTSADVAWAKAVEKDDVYADFREALGPWFAEGNFPLLTDFLRQLTADVQAENRQVKDLYKRARPPVVEPTVQPCVRIPTTNSYPSGHSLRGYVWAAVLGDVFRDSRVALNARAHQIAWGRVIGGVHFPSDTIGARMAAQAIVAEMRKNPAYRAAIEKCRAEVAPYLHQKAA